MGAPGDRECWWPIEWVPNEARWSASCPEGSWRLCYERATHAVLWPDGSWPATRCEAHAHDNARETKARGMVVCPIEDVQVIQHGLLVRKALDPQGVLLLMGPTPYELVETPKGGVALAVPPEHEDAE
jgi:hypothetical protein